MQICLVSDNPTLSRVCRAVLVKVGAQDWDFCQAKSNSASEKADLYVWDLDYCRELFAISQLAKESVHVVLAQTEDVAKLTKTIGVALTTLVKPFSPEYLAAVLENMIQSLSQQADVGATQDSLLGRTQRDRLLQCLMHLNMRVQQYHIEQMNFLARALHDFRAPLTAIAGYCSLLQSQDPGPLGYKQVEMLTRMECSTKRLSRLVTDTFQLSVRHSSERKLDVKSDNILVCIQNSIDEAASLASLKNLTVEHSLTAPTKPLCFDREEIARVLTNLLDNAYKFTPTHGVVRVEGCPHFWERRDPGIDFEGHDRDRRTKTSNDPNSYRIDIKDSGPGIPEAELDRIFQPYSSYAGSQDRAGAGLGLAICRMILEAHEGKIFAASSEEGAFLSLILPYGKTSKARSDILQDPSKHKNFLTSARAKR